MANYCFLKELFYFLVFSKMLDIYNEKVNKNENIEKVYISSLSLLLMRQYPTPTLSLNIRVT